MRAAAFLSFYLLLSCLLRMTAIAANQSGPPEPKAMPRISAAEAESRLTKKVDPVYPKMAKINHELGEVVLNIVISPEGKVVDVKTLSGPTLLIQAATDAVNQWEYRPYPEEDMAQAVATIVHINFTGPGSTETPPLPADPYEDQELLCKTLLVEQAYHDAEPACALLPGLAEKAESIKDQESAYQYAGQAYYQLSKYKDAVTAWQHQLEIARKNNSPSDVAWVHSNVALALAGAGDLSGAEANWEQARNMLEAAHQRSPDDPDVSDRLGRVLTAYGKLLRRMGDSAKAEALEKEAASLNH